MTKNLATFFGPAGICRQIIGAGSRDSFDGKTLVQEEMPFVTPCGLKELKDIFFFFFLFQWLYLFFFFFSFVSVVFSLSYDPYPGKHFG